MSDIITDAMQLDKLNASFKVGKRIFNQSLLPKKGLLEAIKKHYPGQHDQLTHGRKKGGRVVVSEDKSPDTELASVADQYLRDQGYPPRRKHAKQALTPEEGRALADAYDNAISDVNNPKAKQAYAQFIKELDAQHAALEKAGFKMLPWEQKGQPYQNSAEMIKDVSENKRLYYFKTTEGTSIHGLMTTEANDKFRAVHDIFGHAQGGNSFGPKGELNAFLDHVQMFTPEAQLAMATETLFQNAWFNNSKHNEGKPVQERDFAEQKAVVFDPKLYEALMKRRDETVEKQIADDEEDLYFTCPAHRDAPHPKKKTKKKKMSDRIKESVNESTPVSQ